MADVNERKTNNRGRLWLPLAADTAAAYEPDALGGYSLVALVIYSPDASKLRRLKMRELERVERETLLGKSPWPSFDPPTQGQLAGMWNNLRLHGEMVDGIHSRFLGWVADQISETTAPGMLTRRDGEDPDAFYRRIAIAHIYLSNATRRPTAELAQRAGVPVGRATVWVSRARSRGIYDQVLEGMQNDDEEAQP